MHKVIKHHPKAVQFKTNKAIVLSLIELSQ